MSIPVPIVQAFIATLFTWFITALGAATVFFTRTVDQKLIAAMMGFAAGVMIAASFWSLLAPAIEMTAASGGIAWLPAVTGFMVGGAFLWATDKVLPHLHPGLSMREAEGVPTHLQRSVLLVLAITLHNFSEGLAVGVAFGAVASGLPGATLPAAIGLAIGIGLQNFPKASRWPCHCEVKACRARRASGMGNCRRWSSQLPACWAQRLC